MSEQDIAAALESLTQSSHAFEALSGWVHGVDELPVAQSLQTQGVVLEFKRGSWPQRLGVLVQEAAAGVTVRRVQTAGAAEQAGFAVGDEWLAVEVTAALPAVEHTASQAEPTATSEAVGAAADAVDAVPSSTLAPAPQAAHAAKPSTWRIKKLEDLEALLPEFSRAQSLRALVARDGQLLWLALALPGADAVPGDASLTAAEPSKLAAWLLV